jgi:hypothetical protein
MNPANAHDALPTPPRPVRRRAGLPFGTALSFAILGSLACFVFLMGNAVGGVLIDALGIETSGTVVAKTVDQRKAPRYYLSYTYHHGDRDLTGRDRVTEAAWNRLPPPDGIVRVRSLHVLGISGSRIVGAEAPPASWICPLAFGLFAEAPFAASFASWWIGVRRRQWLVAHGESAVGTVTEKRVHRGRRTSYETEYFYVSEDGRRCCGLWSTTEVSEDQRLPIGKEVVVFYSRANPDWGSVLHGFSEFVVVSAEA